MVLTFLLICIAATLAGAAGGAVSGMRLGGAAMGLETAAMMGGVFALSAVGPAAIVAGLVHALR